MTMIAIATQYNSPIVAYQRRDQFLMIAILQLMSVPAGFAAA